MVITGVAVTMVVSIVDAEVAGDVEPSGVVPVHPAVSRSPSIRIARNPVICQFFIFSLSFDRRYIFLIQDYRGVIIHFWSQKGKPEVLLYGAGCVPTIDLSGSYVGSYVNREYTTFLKN